MERDSGCESGEITANRAFPAGEAIGTIFATHGVGFALIAALDKR